MSKPSKRTIVLSLALLLVAAALVVAIRVQRSRHELTQAGTSVDDGPYRLIGSDSHVTVRMFGQKAGWMDIQFPVESARVVDRTAGLSVTTSLRWSQARIEPDTYAGAFSDFFRPGRALENRFEFELGEVPVPAPGQITSETVPVQTLLYGQHGTRDIDIKVIRSAQRLTISTTTMATMNLNDFKADKLVQMLSAQSGAKVSPLFELRFDLAFEPNAASIAP